MTFFAEIIEKSQFIQNYSNAALNQEINRHIHACLENSKDQVNLAPGTAKYLAFDLSYLMFRHLGWHQAPLFSELCIDYLNSEFRLPNSIATSIVETCLDLFNPYFKATDNWSPETFDKEFLFDLFVASATAKNEAKLRADIGFGKNLIQLFHSAARLASDQATQTFAFAPKVTQSIISIMDDIAREAEACPWIMDIYKLRLILSPKIHQANNLRLTRHQLHRVFTILTMIGWQGKKHLQLEGELGQSESDQKQNGHVSPTISFQQSLRTLSAHQLIYCHRIRSEDYYHLSASGLDLCSNYLAHMEQESIEDIQKLCRLPASIQSKVIDAHLSQAVNPDLNQFLKIAHRLSPESVEVMVTRFAGIEHSQQLLELLQKLLHNSQNAWARVKMVHALTNLRDFHGHEVSSILSQIAQQDSSPMVRKSARSLQAEL